LKLSIKNIADNSKQGSDMKIQTALTFILFVLKIVEIASLLLLNIQFISRSGKPTRVLNRSMRSNLPDSALPPRSCSGLASGGIVDLYISGVIVFLTDILTGA